MNGSSALCWGAYKRSLRLCSAFKYPHTRANADANEASADREGESRREMERAEESRRDAAACWPEKEGAGME